MWHPYHYGPWQGPEHMFYWGNVFMWILLAVLIVIVVYVIIRTSGQQSNQEALEILKIRYAKGEINKEQFDEMKKELQK